MSRPDISIVSLTWNSQRFIQPLLDSLWTAARADRVNLEVIIVDNGSTDGTKAEIEKHRAGGDLTVIPLSHNQGTTKPRNLGIRRAKGDHIMILDSDTRVPEGTLRGLLNSFDEIDSDQEIGIVHPKLVYPDGEFQESARRFPTMLTKAYRLLKREAARTRDESIADVLAGNATPVDYAISACWFMRRSVFDRVGLLDERIFYAPEDVEYCIRCWKRGFSVWYYPSVSVIHDCQRITNKRPISKLGASHAKELVRLWWDNDMFFSRPEAAQLSRK